MKRSPPLALLFALAFGLWSCGGSDGPTAPSGSSGSPQGGGNAPAPTDRLQRDPQPGGNFLSEFPFDHVFSGGVPKDGIPALTDPDFDSAPWSNARYLRDTDLVLGVVINGEAKAYPHNIGWRHEIVNDIVGGQPIVVSLCPLTSTGMVFDGQGKDGNRITAGVSGLLFNSNLIMYDRRDNETLYPQMLYRAVEGATVGDELKLLPVVETTWRYWKQLYPDTKVVSGSSGPYTTYPYGNYRVPNTAPFVTPFPAPQDNPTIGLFAPKEMTLGIRFGEIAKAYPFRIMGAGAIINDTVANNPILVIFYAREQLAIPYSRNVGGQTLTFANADSPDPLYPFLLKDGETSTTWNLKGEAIDGPLKGQRLEQMPAHNAFWFAWATFWQHTGIY